MAMNTGVDPLLNQAYNLTGQSESGQNLLDIAGFATGFAPHTVLNMGSSEGYLSGDSMFGGTQANQLSTLTEGQGDLLANLSGLANQGAGQLYGGLGSLFSSPQDAYQSLDDFEGTFDAQYGDPLKQQYEADLAQNQNSGELFSGGTNANNFRAMSKFNTNLASSRASMMMKEREQQQSSAENSYNRQLQAGQLLSQLTTSPLSTKAVENVVSQDAGVLGNISETTSVGGGLIGGLFKGISGIGG